MTRPGIEPRSPGPLVNTLTIMPMSGSMEKEMEIYSSISNNSVLYKYAV